jgi:phosphate starvation-inducible PhoH-like protein
MYEATLPLVEPDLVLSLLGTCDQHLRIVRDALGVTITHRDGQLRVAGEEQAVTLATEVFERLKDMAERSGPLDGSDVSQILSTVTSSDRVPHSVAIDVVNGGRTIRPRTAGQSRYVDAIRRYEIVFAAGPAGTGKTYLAVALAVEALKHQRIRKIVLVRPAVEAGESLGYLPGDLQAKINPYLRPLLDALNEMIDYDQIKLYMDQDIIEVIPLAYMRGRTLNEAFIILDEAQNTSVAQMKMFLTRMGDGSRIVIAGDTTQVDLPPHTRSGMVDAVARLKKIPGISMIHLSKSDIVRHRLVQQIVNAYDDMPRGTGGKKGRR